MSLIGEIQNGQYVNDKTGSTSEKTKKATDQTKEMFLQLLVTEMQYQDPLQPTDNSEYVKELATFSQVEALNSVSDKMNELQASALVGNYVTLTDGDGDEIKGCVDYVTTDSGSIKVSVEGNLYDVDSITSVQDATFYNAGVLGETFKAMVAKLPTVSNLNVQRDTSAINEARSFYDSLSEYVKKGGFIDEADLAKLTALEKKLKGDDSTDNTSTTTDTSTTSTGTTTGA